MFFRWMIPFLAFAAVSCASDGDAAADELALPTATSQQTWVVQLGGHVLGLVRVWRGGIGDDGLQVTHWQRDYGVVSGGERVAWRSTTRARLDEAGVIRVLERQTETDVQRWSFDEAAEVVIVEEATSALGRAQRGETVQVTALLPSEGVVRAVALTAGDGPGVVEAESASMRWTLRVDEAGRVAEQRAGALVVEPAPEPVPELAWVDLLGLLGRKVDVPPSAGQRSSLALEVVGMDLTGMHHPPRQVVDGARVEIRVPLRAEIPAERTSPDEALAAWLEVVEGTEDAAQRGAALAGEESDQRRLVERLVAAVEAGLDRRLVPGAPDPGAVLRAGKGDCNDHAALFVAMARGAGIPARAVEGLAYADTDVEPGFYPHGWAEVHLGESVGWVPVDPVRGEPIADAAHLRIEAGPTWVLLLEDVTVRVAPMR